MHEGYCAGAVKSVLVVMVTSSPCKQLSHYNNSCSGDAQTTDTIAVLCVILEIIFTAAEVFSEILTYRINTITNYCLC